MRRCNRFRIGVLVGSVSFGSLGILIGIGPAAADNGFPEPAANVLYVSNGTAGYAGQDCANAQYSAIGAAVAAAGPGSTVVVCQGTYHEDVVLNKPLTLLGENATINAAGKVNGVQVLASNITVAGFYVEGATGEGILVGAFPGASGAPGTVVSYDTIEGNTVQGNDQGNFTGDPISNSSYPECNETVQPAPAPPIPGDCGEGIHLVVANHVTVSDNYVTANAGGILLTDEFGPTYDNLIDFNVVVGNLYDCGVTLAGHSASAFTAGVPQPSAAGIYGNTVQTNWINGNGVDGEGGGVLLASPLPGGAVYSNLIQGNYIEGNGLAGVTVHSHAPSQDLNGNVVSGNYIGTNNVDPDFDFNAPPTPYHDPNTTGIIVATIAPLSITVNNNLLLGDVYGMWLMPAAVVATSSPNSYVSVTKSVCNATPATPTPGCS